MHETVVQCDTGRAVTPMPSWPSYSIAEAAEKTGYHPEYLRELIRNEKIEAVKIGQMWLIKVESLEAYIEEMKRSGDYRAGPRR
jgi:excisionase family DNA binding protein